MSTSIPRGNILKLFAVAITADVTSRTANTTTEFDFTVPGVLVGDIVVAVTKPSLSAGIGVVNARVKSDNTVAVSFVDATGAGVDPASEQWIFVIGRAEFPSTGLPNIFNA